MKGETVGNFLVNLIPMKAGLGQFNYDQLLNPNNILASLDGGFTVTAVVVTVSTLTGSFGFEPKEMRSVLEGYAAWRLGVAMVGTMRQSRK